MGDEDMGWWLANEVAATLPGDVRARVYVELGSGNGWRAIHLMLAGLAGQGGALSDAARSTVASWLDGYMGCVEEPEVRALLARCG